ncbi:DNA polymerase III subunit alpha [Candidatus Saccharibacteria bacterium]|nr:DNA polymerase III subunit alpha [Candidatus Saccharibacteria bacterium]
MSKGKIQLAARDFVHLHNHSNHSVLDGMTKISELIEITKNFDQNAVAVTDHGTLSGWIEFYKEARAQDIKPILGIETYVAARKHNDRDLQKDKMRYHLTLLAENETGMKNLMRLSTIANLDGVYYKPRVDHDLLEKYKDGIFVLSGCASGEIGENLRSGDYEKAKEIAEWYKSVFGDHYYIEVQDHGHPAAPKHWEIQRQINEGALKIAEELDIPAVVTADAHYAQIDDTEAHEILLCVGTGSFLSDKDRMSLADFHLHVTDPREIIERWGDERPDLILNSKKIAEACNIEIKMGDILIPKFDCPDGEDEKSYLDKLVWRGLAWRYGAAPQDNGLSIERARKLLPAHIRERAEYELGVVERMGFDGYFLIVWDFINWGKNKGIVFGPGRGSAAGSIIAYALRITELDPMEFDLLFERFLNPDRISMPDIDIDIQDTRRDEVIAYCTEKYGVERVANITTFGTMAARAAYKDVARVLEVPYTEADRISKLIPPPQQGHHQKLADSIKNDTDLRAEYETNPTTKRCLDFAIRLEGTIRSHGVHAAGVVIAPDDLVKFAPLEMAQKGVVATQFPMDPIMDLGLLKMDFLGLSNLTIINNTLRIIKKVYGEIINLSNLAMDDAKTFQLFQKGETVGVFQFESAGMQRHMRELKPTHFDDLIAMNALYRPGPMQFIPSFIRRKNGEEKITYLHPKMENSLKDTYGILVYQEQFMNISKDLCGFTGGEADFLRKAVGKKKIDMMLEIKPKFIDGAMKNSDMPRDIMEQFWSQLEEFANYCFNKSHSACYALVGYWTAYLKAHYPAAFMAALMTSDANNTDRLAIEIAECNRLGLRVTNPDVNESFPEFAVVPETGNIRFGLAAVKNVGTTTIDDLMNQRDNFGKFESVEDFARRVNSRTCNRKVWEALIKAGAFDGFATTIDPTSDDDPQVRGDRSDLLFNLDNIIAFSQKVQKEAASGQGDLFDMLGDEAKVAGAATHLEITPSPSKISEKEQLGWERELLGLYLSSHPLDKYDVFFREQTHAAANLNSDQHGCKVVVGGLLQRWRVIQTKQGGKMAFAGIEDKTGEVEVVIFPKLFETLPPDLDVGAVVQIAGYISGRDRDGNKTPDPSVIADELEIIGDEKLNNYQPTGVPKGEVEVPSESSDGLSRKRSARATPPTKKNGKKGADLSAVEERRAKLFIHVKDPSDGDKLLKLKEKLKKHPGDDEVILVLGVDKKDAVRMPFGVTIDDKLIAAVGKIYGADCVAMK